MSKPISFGFGKAQGSSIPSSTSAKTSISLGSKPAALNKPAIKKASALTHDDDDDDLLDEAEPKHEELTGFSGGGAILSTPAEEKKLLVIANAGNLDWRKTARGKNILPREAQEAQNGQAAVLVEKNEVNKASGLQFADRRAAAAPIHTISTASAAPVPEPTVSADEEALRALLTDDGNIPQSSTVIQAQEDAKFGTRDDDLRDLRELVQEYPDSSTLEDYAAMPVEEFGMAMLRGMGKKRRANGEIIQLESDVKKKEPRRREQGGYLGIGAKPAPGMEGVELGAWGKADMRKNNKGAGFFTPVMVRDAKTGETITEEELERRKTVAKDGQVQGKQHRDRGRERSPRDHESTSYRYKSRSRSKERRRRHDDDYSYHKSSSPRRDIERDRDRHAWRDKHYDRGDRRHRD